MLLKKYMYLCIKLNKKVKDKLDIAVRYYRILAAVHSFQWTDTEIHVLAFLAVKGNINAGGARDVFIEWHKGTSKNYLSSLLSAMKDKGLIIRKGRRATINPSLNIELTDNLRLQLNISSDV